MSAPPSGSAQAVCRTLSRGLLLPGGILIRTGVRRNWRPSQLACGPTWVISLALLPLHNRFDAVDGDKQWVQNCPEAGRLRIGAHDSFVGQLWALMRPEGLLALDYRPRLRAGFSFGNMCAFIPVDRTRLACAFLEHATW